jgi:hypothetical protein
MDIKPLPSSISDAIKKCPLIIGIGPSAWPRIITSYYFPKFKTICLNDSQDDEYIRGKGNDVFSLKKEDPTLEVSPQTPGRIINTDVVKDYVAKLKEPFSFLVYKSSTFLEKVCAKEGWSFIGNAKEHMDLYENKKIFKEILREIGVETIPGENILIDELTDERFLDYQKKLGQKRLVLQLAEVTSGGGSGTFFIEDVSDLKYFRERADGIRKAFEGKKKKIETVNIAPFITGTSSSVSCCATHLGTLTGPIQTQIIDVEQVTAKEKGRSGKYAGTDWSYRRYDSSSQKQADYIAQKFGEYIYKHGYRGIFGIDLIVEENGKVWPVECNPRDTDAFPMISMLMMDAGCVPLDVFHNLENLGIDYEFDFEKINQSYKLKPFEAAQILIENRLDSGAYIRGMVKVGVYSIKDGDFVYKKEGFSLFDLTSDDEVLITEGVPKNFGERGYPISGRIFRLIKRSGILQKDGVLLPEVSEPVEKIYSQLKLTPIPDGLVEKRGLTTLYINKPSFFGGHEEEKNIDVVNVIGNTQEGSRPFKIAWRKKIDKDVDLINQIPSKRARKHIKSDSQKLDAMGIEIKIVEEIDGSTFKSWLSLYREIINAKENGEVMVDEDWLTQKRQKGKKVGAILAYQKGELIGGELFFEIGARLAIGYGVSRDMNGFAGSLTLLMDFKFLEYARQNGYEEVSFGQDTNLYGYDLSCGLISYKLKLGFYPVPANKTFWVKSYFLNLDKFGEEVSYFAGSDENLQLVTISGNEQKNDVVKNDREFLLSSMIGKIGDLFP